MNKPKTNSQSATSEKNTETMPFGFRSSHIRVNLVLLRIFFFKLGVLQR